MACLPSILNGIGDFPDQFSDSYSWGVYFRPGISHISLDPFVIPTFLIGLLVDFHLTLGLLIGLESLKDLKA